MDKPAYKYRIGGGELLLCPLRGEFTQPRYEGRDQDSRGSPLYCGLPALVVIPAAVNWKSIASKQRMQQGWQGVVGKRGHSRGRAGVVPPLWEACQVAHSVHEDGVDVHRPLRTPLCRGGELMRCTSLACKPMASFCGAVSYRLWNGGLRMVRASDRRSRVGVVRTRVAVRGLEARTLPSNLLANAWMVSPRMDRSRRTVAERIDGDIAGTDDRADL